MIDWHKRHQFCSTCGTPSKSSQGGYLRLCTNDACGAQHFPRTDPVVIMLATRSDQCLMGRQPGFPPNMFSALAGFMEPGETIADAVRREVMEEAGVEVGDVRYHSSQPWPFPTTLMIGCQADAATSEITRDEGEMTDVRWFTRKDVLSGLAGTNENLALPGSIAIAYHLITAWAKNDVP